MEALVGRACFAEVRHKVPLLDTSAQGSGKGIGEGLPFLNAPAAKLGSPSCRVSLLPAPTPLPASQPRELYLRRAKGFVAAPGLGPQPLGASPGPLLGASDFLGDPRRSSATTPAAGVPGRSSCEEVIAGLSGKKREALWALARRHLAERLLAAVVRFVQLLRKAFAKSSDLEVAFLFRKSKF